MYVFNSIVKFSYCSNIIYIIRQFWVEETSKQTLLCILWVASLNLWGIPALAQLAPTLISHDIVPLGLPVVAVAILLVKLYFSDIENSFEQGLAPP
jgi:hypothetical protein